MDTLKTTAARVVDFGHPLTMGMEGWWGSADYDQDYQQSAGGPVWQDRLNLSNLTYSGGALSLQWNNPLFTPQIPNRSGTYGGMLFDGTGTVAKGTSYPGRNFGTAESEATLACWCCPIGTLSAGDRTLLCRADAAGATSTANFRIYMDQSNFRAKLGVGGSSQNNAANVIVSGVWNHIVGTFRYGATTGNNETLYINGVNRVAPSATTSETFAAGAGIFSVGAFARTAGAVSNFFQGAIDDCMVWNRQLSAAEVKMLYAESWANYPTLLTRPNFRRWFVAPPVQTGIAFDAATNSGAQIAQSTYSWSHTCTGTNRFLAVDVSLLSAGATVTSITYNGVALSAIPGASGSTVTSFGRVECWGLANPASGSNTIAVTLSGSINSVGTAVSYSGVHQSSPTEAGNFNQATNVGAADATVAVTSVADQDWIHAVIACSDGSVTAGQTSRNNVSAVGGTASGADEDFGPQAAGAKTMSYTGVGAAVTWAMAGYAIRPVAASGLGRLFRPASLEGLGGVGSLSFNPSLAGA